MKISKFNKRIQIITQTEGYETDAGSWIKGQEEVVECWAAVKEQYAADVRSTLGTVLEDSVQFLVRLRKVGNESTIRWNGKDYEIIKVVGDPLNNKHTTIYAKRK